MNNLLNILTNMLSMPQNNNNLNYANRQNVSDYPDAIFTNTAQTNNNQHEHHSFSQNNQTTQMSNILSNLIPMLLGKNNLNISNLTSGLNSNISSILSLFNKKEQSSAKSEKADYTPSINLSNYTVVN